MKLNELFHDMVKSPNLVLPNMEITKFSIKQHGEIQIPEFHNMIKLKLLPSGGNPLKSVNRKRKLSHL